MGEWGVDYDRGRRHGVIAGLIGGLVVGALAHMLATMGLVKLVQWLTTAIFGH